MVKYLLKGSLFIVTLAQNMKSPVLGLAFLFSAMSWVHCQTAPYVSFLGTNLPNHSYVDMGLVGRNDDGSDSVQCHTDLDTCCNNQAGPDRGDWYFPDMSRLPFHRGIFERRGIQRVDLRGHGGASGIYHCDIETVAVHDASGRERIYVGLYSSGGE